MKHNTKKKRTNITKSIGSQYQLSIYLLKYIKFDRKTGFT